MCVVPRLVPPTPVTTARMRAVRQRDTKPEMSVRRLIHGLGVRFRCSPADLPGHPDIANKSQRWCIFVHGCFWHGHPGCWAARLPKVNRDWWKDKIHGNRLRDERKVRELRQGGFRVLNVWECELHDAARLTTRLRHFLMHRQSPD